MALLNGRPLSRSFVDLDFFDQGIIDGHDFGHDGFVVQFFDFADFQAVIAAPFQTLFNVCPDIIHRQRRIQNLSTLLTSTTAKAFAVTLHHAGALHLPVHGSVHTGAKSISIAEVAALTMGHDGSGGENNDTKCGNGR